MQLWRVAFALQAITFLPLSLLIVNPEWIANYSDWIFPDDSQGRVFGVMSLFVTFTSGVAAFETIYPRVEVIVHACMGTFAFGATVLIFDTMHHDNPEPLHYVFSTIFAIAALFWMGVGFVNTLGPRNKGD